MHDINIEPNDEEMREFLRHVETRINATMNDTQVITEAAILEMYWTCGETLIQMRNASKEELTNFQDAINQEIKDDPLLGNNLVNIHWLALSKIWVAEHKNHNKDILLSGLVSWEKWALLLDTVNSAPHRYRLACQSIKQEWDKQTLLSAAKSLPKQFLNSD